MRRVLFLCTGNCVRSPMAEALLRYRGGARFEAFSAGAHPAGIIHPLTLRALAEIRIPNRQLRSKSWRDLETEAFDAIVTLCPDARDEILPEWPAARHADGLPVAAHWGFEDPILAQVFGEEARLREFRRTRDGIRQCVERLALAPPRITDDNEAFAALVREIGEHSPRR